MSKHPTIAERKLPKMTRKSHDKAERVRLSDEKFSGLRQHNFRKTHGRAPVCLPRPLAGATPGMTVAIQMARDAFGSRKKVFQDGFYEEDNSCIYFRGIRLSHLDAALQCSGP
jgi:hypothetical protein